MLEILKDFIDWLITQFWDIVQTLLIALLSVIPVPDWANDVAPAINTMVATASYPMWLAAFDVGLPIMASAMGIRFFIRRIPGIG
jgi:hypothetical protein